MRGSRPSDSWVTQLRIVCFVAILVLLGLLFGMIAAKAAVTNVPVLNREVLHGKAITQSDISWVSWPLNGSGVMTDALGDPVFVMTEAGLTHMLALVDLPANTPILSATVATPAEYGARVNPSFPGAGPGDATKLAFFIQMGNGAPIPVGSYVSIMRNSPTISGWVLQKIRIISLRSKRGTELKDEDLTAKGAGFGGYVVSVTPAEALILGSIPPSEIVVYATTPDAPNLPLMSSDLGEGGEIIIPVESGQAGLGPLPGICQGAPPHPVLCSRWDASPSPPVPAPSQATSPASTVGFATP